MSVVMLAPVVRENRAVRAVDIAIEIVLVALLAFCPLALGAVDAWSEGIAFGLGAGLAVLVAIRAILNRQRETRWWVYVPVGAYLLIAAIQLLPLPAVIVRGISPEAVQVRKTFLADLPNSTDLLHRMTLSLYPWATRHDLRLVLLASIVLAAVMSAFGNMQRIRRLMMWMALIGGAIAALALAQDLTHTSAIYWHIELGRRADSGPFVNHNHFAQFINLCLGAALGLLLASLQPDASGRRRIAWWTIPILIVGGVTVPLSLSRGGMAAMGVAGLALLLMLGWRRGLKRVGAIVLTIGIVVFAGLLLAGFDRVYERVATLNDPSARAGRVQMDLDALRVWRQFPAGGIGLGAHQWVFPRYERQVLGSVATHVENEYVQTLEEMGVAGFCCLLAFVAIVIAALIRASRRDGMAVSGAAIGLGYGVVAVMVHSLSDYGQHLPAVACLSAATCGLLINLGWPRREGLTRSRPARVGVGIFGTVAVVVALWMGWSSWRAYRGAVTYDRARSIGEDLEAQDWQGSDAAYAELLANAANGVRWQPEKIEYRYWDGAFRWHAVTRRQNAQGQTVLEGEDLARARKVIADLNQARALCPTFGPIYWYIGQRERMLHDEAAGERHLNQATELAPYDATAWLLAGEMDAENGRWDAAAAKLRRAIALDGSLLDQVIEEYVQSLNAPRRAITLFADDPRRLLVLSNRLKQMPGKELAASEARQRAKALLEQRAQMPDVSSTELRRLAYLYYGDGDYAKAEKCYARVIRLNYGDLAMHLGRAEALIHLGRKSEAREEARTALRLDAGNARAEAMLKRLQEKRER